MVLKVRRKGVLILPKVLREQVGIEEGDEMIAEVVGGTIVLRPLKPRIVDIDVKKVHDIVRREKKDWDERLDALARKAGA